MLDEEAVPDETAVVSGISGVISVGISSFSEMIGSECNACSDCVTGSVREAASASAEETRLLSLGEGAALSSVSGAISPTSITLSGEALSDAQPHSITAHSSAATNFLIVFSPKNIIF